MFAAELEEIPKDGGPVTVRHSAVRAKVLASRTTISGKFTVTGGHHLNSKSKGIFKSMEVEAWNETMKDLVKQREEQKNYTEIEKKGTAGSGLDRRRPQESEGERD